MIAEVGAWCNPLSPDESTRKSAVEKCKQGLALAEKISARCCVNIAGSRGAKWDGPCRDDLTEETFGMMVEVVRGIIDDVRPQRSCYVLETMPWIGVEVKNLENGTHLLRKGGEVVLVGVPWRRCTELSAHELLSAVFHQFAFLRSGWELPHHTSDFRPHSIFSGYQLALRWLSEQRMPLEGSISLHDPVDAQSVYQGLVHGTAEGLFHIFDWDLLSSNG